MINIQKIIKKKVDLDVLDYMKKNTSYTKEFLELVIGLGLDTPNKLRNFLHPRIINLSNPFIINDIEKAVIRTKKAIQNKEKIFIYGDKDVDGQSSISLLFLNLKDYHLDPIYYIPDDEGYGVHKSILNTLIEKNVKLMITVDCGISNKEELEYIKSYGIDVIVLDHHEAVGDIPIIDATVDPKIITKYYNETNINIRMLAGCGVVFYFLWALKMSFTYYFNKFFAFFKININETQSISKIEIFIVKNGLIEENIIISLENNNFDDSSENINFYKKVLSKEDLIKEILNLLNNKSIDFFVFFDLEIFKKYFLIFDEMKKFFSNKNIVYIKEIYSKLYKEECKDITFFYKKLNFYDENKVYNQNIAKFYWNLLFINDFSIKNFFKKYLSFVCLGTISDIMPLKGENRFLTKYGIMKLKQNILGIKFLVDFNDSEKTLTAKYLAWNITPFLNSAGRMGRPDLGVEFLCSKSKKEISILKEKIDDLNNNRRELQKKDERLSDKILKQKYSNDFEKFIFVSSSNFEKNLTGLVASNLMKKYFKPTFVLSIDKEKTTGSVRAPKKFNYNVVDILNLCNDTLEKFGGHKLAGGFTLKNDNIEKFEKKLIEIFDDIDSKIKINNLDDTIEIPLVMNSENITYKFLSEISLLEPFGESNNNPIFLLKNINFLNYGFIGGKKEHFKGKILTQDKIIIDVLGWNKRKEIEEFFKNNKNINFLVSVEKDDFTNEKKYRLNIHELV